MRQSHHILEGFYAFRMNVDQLQQDFFYCQVLRNRIIADRSDLICLANL